MVMEIVRGNGKMSQVEQTSQSLAARRADGLREVIIPPVPADLPEPELTPNSITVLKRRYLRKDSSGKPAETPKEMLWRVAWDIASPDKIYNPDADVMARAREFYNLMVSLDFLPNSPTLMNAGTGNGLQYSACYVLPVEDSLEGIFEAIKHAAIIHKSGGGTGFSFSRLRPKDDIVSTTGGIASGPVSFMRVFNAATEAVKQGGTRRGANMAILNVDHPDILEFITIKNDLKEMTNFNISVGITEAFMKAVEADEEYPLINPKNGEVMKTLKARDVFNLIVDSAWQTGEPGIVFLDRINSPETNPTPKVGMIESTNPCGEQPLLPYEACNLGSVNLANMAKADDGRQVVDWDKLRRTVQVSIRFLDNVIDANQYPLPQIDKMVKDNRKIGLGVMGWADMLFMLGILYNSQEALDLAESIMKFINEVAKETSRDIAAERGPFQNYWDSVYNTPDARPFRNATVTTIAPTGTISIIAGCSSGIEPIFALAFTRNVMDNDRLPEVNPVFEEVAKKEGFWSEALMEKIASAGSIQGMEEIPEAISRVFVVARDITPEWHIRMQAAFQKYTDNAVSKTVNFPREATPEDVRQVYLLAYQLGCKGVTIYRDGSRAGQVLTTGEEKPAEATTQLGLFGHDLVTAGRIVPRPRPMVTFGRTERIRTGEGDMYVTVNEDEKGACEAFAQIGKAGGCASAMMEAQARLISLCLRSGIAVEAIVKQLRGIRCSQPAWTEGGQVLSCPDGVGIVLERYLDSKSRGVQLNAPTLEATQVGENAESKKAHHSVAAIGGPTTCPDCGGRLTYEEGCATCHLCGFTRCG